MCSWLAMLSYARPMMGWNDTTSSPCSPRQEHLLPGTVLAKRYRILAQLGRGAMGEVYRADDLKLGQSVALKFLPGELQADPIRLDRFLTEVKLARRVAHPNVCRVYDAGEVEGQHFLTMEYIDGEDLASLLRRIGRIPPDKAVQIAGQLCSGLAAIHAEGILHRDLKPTNVMVDGRGQVRITDFGVASLAEEVQDGEVCGTPEYMSPEQLSGQGVSLKSDLYGLGLVLFEIFTGRRAFESAATRFGENARPPDPVQIAMGLGPEIGQAILHCLEPDPDDRPDSAVAVLAELPGSDPLQALLAAGQTPRPEMVAASGVRGSIDWRRGGALMGVLVCGLLLIAFAADDTMLFRRSHLDKPPEVLADKAREILKLVGHTEPPGNTAYGFGDDASSLGYRKPDGDSAKSDHLGRLPAMYFWYRQSSSPLTPQDRLGRVNRTDPPFYSMPGEVSLVLDSQGRLLELLVSPEHSDGGTETSLQPYWKELFAAAGLDFEKFMPAKSRWLPPVIFDAYSSWDGSIEAESKAAIHVETGSYDGRPAFFRMETPWGPNLPDLPKVPEWPFDALYSVFYLFVVIGCLVEVRRNLRQSRGDWTGARRLALYVFSITLLHWLLRSNHPAEMAQVVKHFTLGVSLGLYKAILLCWVPYMALEPHLRSRWPEKIVSWARLLAGRVRDPLVGRDVLIGICVAVVLQLLLRLYYFVPKWLGIALPPPERIAPDTLLGPRYYVSELLAFQEMAVFYGFALLFLLLLVRALLRSELLAGIVIVGLATAMWYGELSTVYPILSLTVTGLRMAGFVLVVKHWGVLALIVGIFFDNFLNTFPITTGFSEWYTESSIFALIVAAGLGAYALSVALGGRTRRPVSLA